VIIIGIELRMNVLVVEQDKEPYIEKIWNDLDTMRKKIGSLEIEVVEYEDILIIYNSRGLKDNVPINRYFNELAIRGTFLIAKNNVRELDFEGITAEQIKKYTKIFQLDKEKELEL